MTQLVSLIKMRQKFKHVLMFNLGSCHRQMALFPLETLTSFAATGDDSGDNTIPKLGHQNSIEPYSTDNRGRWHKNIKTI